MNLDEKELNLLSTLVALGEANPRNSQIQNMVMGKFMEMVTPQQTEQERIKDLLAQGFAGRVASGEGDVEEALGFLESLTKEGDTSPITSLKQRMGEKSSKNLEIGEVPDDMRDQAVANKYQELYNNAIQKGDYSQLEAFKQKYRDYNFDVDQEGVVSASPRDRGLASKLASIFGGEEAGRETQAREDMERIVSEFYGGQGFLGLPTGGGKYGLLGPAQREVDRSRGFSELNTDEGKQFLKKKGVNKELLDSLGRYKPLYQGIRLD